MKGICRFVTTLSVCGPLFCKQIIFHSITVLFLRFLTISYRSLLVMTLFPVIVPFQCPYVSADDLDVTFETVEMAIEIMPLLLQS